MSGGVAQVVFSGPLVLALPVAAAAGAITFLSPCCLPLVPGYLSYVTGMSASAVPAGSRGAEEAGPAGTGRVAAATLTAIPQLTGPRSRVILGTLLFVAGFAALFTVEGVIVSAVGVALSEHQEVLSRILGGVVILLGLMFTGMFDRFATAGRIFRPAFRPQAGLAGAPVLGVLFGLSWTPCSGPTLGAVLTLSESSGTALRGGLLAFVYGLGLGIPFLIVALALQRGIQMFGFARRHARLIAQLGGLMLIVVGVLEVTGTWASAILWLKLHWLSGYNAPF